MRKAVLYGVLIGLLIGLTFDSGCTSAGVKQSTIGPVREGHPVSGDLTNATVTINDNKVVYYLVGIGAASLVGVLVCGAFLVKHHAKLKALT